MADISRWSPFRRSRNGRREEGNVPARRGDPFDEFTSLRDSFFRDPFRALDQSFFGDFSAGQFSPNVDLSDEGDSLKVTAELPGMSSDDLELTLDEDRLTIRGEKKMEETKDEEGFYRTERSYGFFERTIPLPAQVNEDACEARFDNGVLAVRLPKVEGKERRGKQLPINGS